ncbi:MAG: DUF2807 domain-containing protein [Lewinellaceae bacterium]|nr:DUF2807 domain-containing protein [Phaeodactylibacter sp.]MCB0614887.1 DUF2807 domain-containing protein [Phaeodactylibacter sp.]MCB9349822.1 DUF2807 domain-containing protein [Lewinellaceae bacterium]
MKQIQWMLFALAITLTTSSCFINVNDEDGFFGSCVNGSGPIVTRELVVAPFTGVEMPISADVFLKQGPEQKVIVEGKDNIIDEIELDVQNGIWKIEFNRCVRDIGQLRVFITMPELTHLRVSGSGDVVGENTFVIQDLEIDIPGSGNVDLSLEADDLDIDIPGSGRLTLEGVADETKYRISGSGDVHAFNLECRVADISIPGSGDVEVFATELLKVRISGSGDVFYRGDPALDISITGSGDVIDAN